jgi:hypothetical protein
MVGWARTLVPVAAVLALSGCGGSSSGSETTTTASPALNATQVAAQLKKAGVPISYPITDVTDAIPEMNSPGLKSEAATATKEADISVEVYGNAEQRNNARLDMIDVNPGAAFIAECGPILVYIPEVEEDAATQKQQRNQIQDALEAAYGAC